MSNSAESRVVLAARREKLETTGSAGARSMGPVSCNAVVATVFAGAATAFATGYAVIAARHHFGHHAGDAHLVEGAQIRSDSLDGLIGARLAALPAA